MKKQFLTYIVIVFCFSFLLKAQEVSTSVLNKVALKSSQKVVFLDLRGSFKEFTEDAILLKLMKHKKLMGLLLSYKKLF